LNSKAQIFGRPMKMTLNTLKYPNYSRYLSEWWQLSLTIYLHVSSSVATSPAGS